MTDDDVLRELIRDLQQLRRGHGLLSPDVVSRIGPRLAEALALDQVPLLQRRQYLSTQISQVLTVLPADLQLAVEAAFALPPADQSRFLRDRMDWLGDQLERDPRTATRRVQSGLALLAEQLLVASGPPAPALPPAGGGGSPGPEDAYAPDGWYVDSFRAALMMHVDPVQLLETRRVSCTRDALEEISVSWSIPADVPEDLTGIRVDMLYGGELRKDELTSTATFWSGSILLPRPLRLGDQHEFQVRVTSTPQRVFRPYYVLSPFRRCDEFILWTKFTRSALPQQIWRVNGVPFQLLDENQPIGELMQPDAVGEVVTRFENLRQGFSYGLRWIA